ncbi:MAG: PqiC family protein [Opitutales bacterium]|jgi:uncharacterized lipoprotein YmbA
MNHRTRCACLLASALTAGMLAGCGSFLSPKPDNSQFYVLSALPQSAAPSTPPAPGVAIGVFSPELPGYLDRPQMVASAGSSQVTVNEYQRWAETLTDGFARVLVQDVATLSGSNDVALFPLTRTFAHEFEVYTLVYQFDGVPGGKVTLRARWRITGPDGQPNYVVQDSNLTADSTPGVPAYQGYVEAMSALVGQMAQQIVAAIPAAKTAEAAELAAEQQAAAEKLAEQQAAAQAMAAKAEAERAAAAQAEAEAAAKAAAQAAAPAGNTTATPAGTPLPAAP